MNKQEIEKAIKVLASFDGTEDIELQKAIEIAVPLLERESAKATQQLNNRWIPVDSGILPEDRDYPPVNCCHVTDKWSDSAIVTGQGKFINSDGCEIYPTHWKPLPSWEEVSQ